MLYSFVVLVLASAGDIATDVIVSEADWSKYNTGGEDAEEPCQNPQVFEVVMCESVQCKECSSDWCKEQCQYWQEEYSLCRCPEWPAEKTSYSHAYP